MLICFTAVRKLSSTDGWSYDEIWNAGLEEFPQRQLIFGGKDLTRKQTKELRVITVIIYLLNPPSYPLLYSCFGHPNSPMMDGAAYRASWGFEVLGLSSPYAIAVICNYNSSSLTRRQERVNQIRLKHDDVLHGRAKSGTSRYLEFHSISMQCHTVMAVYQLSINYAYNWSEVGSYMP